MTLKTFLVSMEDTAVAELKAAGHIAEALVVNEGQKLIAEVKQLPVGTLVLNLFSIFDGQSTLTGAQKMTAVIGAVTPVLQSIQTSGGLKGLETSVVDFANAFANSAYLDFKNVAKPVVAAVEQKLGA